MQRLSRMMQGGGVRSVFFSLLFSLFFIAVSVSAATTISTSISTGGTLSVTGASTLTGLTTMGYASSTTQSLTGNVLVNGRATTTGSNGNFETRGTIVGSSTLQVTGAVTTYGSDTLGDAQADTLTINAGTVTLGNAATTTIVNTFPGAWSIATSSAIIPFVRFDTTNYRFGIATSAPGRMFSVNGGAVFTGDVDVIGTFTPSQTSATTFTVSGATTLNGATTLGDAAGDAIVINGNASSTLFSVTSTAYFGATATSTFDSAGNLSVAGNATTTGHHRVTSLFNVNGNATTTPAGDISTQGTLAVTGVSTFTGRADLNGQASTTRLSAFDRIYVGGTASSTIRGDNVASELPYASTTAITATTASTTNLIVGGNSGNGTLAGMIFGTCNIVQEAVTASTTKGVVCSGATGITTSFKVFVSATSTLLNDAVLADEHGGFAILAASSTGNSLIGVHLSNLTGANNTPKGTLNFWAVK